MTINPAAKNTSSGRHRTKPYAIEDVYTPRGATRRWKNKNYPAGPAVLDQVRGRSLSSADIGTKVMSYKREDATPDVVVLPAGTRSRKRARSTSPNREEDAQTVTVADLRKFYDGLARRTCAMGAAIGRELKATQQSEDETRQHDRNCVGAALETGSKNIERLQAEQMQMVLNLLAKQDERAERSERNFRELISIERKNNDAQMETVIKTIGDNSNKNLVQLGEEFCKQKLDMEQRNAETLKKMEGSMRTLLDKQQKVHEAQIGALTVQVERMEKDQVDTYKAVREHQAILDETEWTVPEEHSVRSVRSESEISGPYCETVTVVEDFANAPSSHGEENCRVGTPNSFMNGGIINSQRSTPLLVGSVISDGLKEELGDNGEYHNNKFADVVKDLRNDLKEFKGQVSKEVDRINKKCSEPSMQNSSSSGYSSYSFGDSDLSGKTGNNSNGKAVTFNAMQQGCGGGGDGDGSPSSSSSSDSDETEPTKSPANKGKGGGGDGGGDGGDGKRNGLAGGDRDRRGGGSSKEYVTSKPSKYNLSNIDTIETDVRKLYDEIQLSGAVKFKTMWSLLKGGLVDNSDGDEKYKSFTRQFEMSSPENMHNEEVFEKAYNEFFSQFGLNMFDKYSSAGSARRRFLLWRAYYPTSMRGNLYGLKRAVTEMKTAIESGNEMTIKDPKGKKTLGFRMTSVRKDVPAAEEWVDCFLRWFLTETQLEEFEEVNDRDLTIEGFLGLISKRVDRKLNLKKPEERTRIHASWSEALKKIAEQRDGAVLRGILPEDIKNNNNNSHNAVSGGGGPGGPTGDLPSTGGDQWKAPTTQKYLCRDCGTQHYIKEGKSCEMQGNHHSKDAVKGFKEKKRAIKRDTATNRKNYDPDTLASLCSDAKSSNSTSGGKKNRKGGGDDDDNGGGGNKRERELENTINQLRSAAEKKKSDGYNAFGGGSKGGGGGKGSGKKGDKGGKPKIGKDNWPEGSWVCSAAGCGKTNYPDRGNCYSCKAGKPAICNVQPGNGGANNGQTHQHVGNGEAKGGQPPANNQQPPSNEESSSSSERPPGTNTYTKGMRQYVPGSENPDADGWSTVVGKTTKKNTGVPQYGAQYFRRSPGDGW